MSDTTTIQWTHDPAACHEPVKTPGLDCPGFPTVHDRVHHMRQVLEGCWDNEPVAPVDRVVDLLADLMHYCDANGINYYAAQLRAEDHHHKEREHTPAPMSHHPASPAHHGLKPPAGICRGCSKTCRRVKQHQRWCAAFKALSTQVS